MSVYFNSEDDFEREAALTEHITSLRGHIRVLGRKDYQQLPGLRSLDYVLMFIPVEPAFLLAIDREPELISEALQHNIMLVSPTTLLVALRTITNLWRYEHQSQNAQRIADRAARLYDKMRLFVDDMSALGQSLDRAQGSYHQAMNKLSEGRGNLIGRIEGFRALGVEIKRPINPLLAQQASEQQDDELLSEPDEDIASLPGKRTMIATKNRIAHRTDDAVARWGITRLSGTLHDTKLTEWQAGQWQIKRRKPPILAFVP
ncbi:DNA recombination protein rmuC [Serratia fonticola]|uniref:DNA recombination protein rmuC n=1 Tax=Serratia fonticola TaxID=47917 RepID=A0A4U9WMU3_SERFO|nr:DNA recombination protein rmuC [Serratia fonticola]